MDKRYNILFSDLIMKCKFCDQHFVDILKHILKNEACKAVYNVDHMMEERRLLRLEKKRSYMKNRYENDKNKILKSKEVYYEMNKDEVRVKQAAYYSRSKSAVCQRQRFRKFLLARDILSYLSKPQEHLFHHSSGFCQPETIKYLNHSVEYDDGACESCDDHKSVKLVGVNRLVCTSCHKAHCTVCKSEVSPNPLLGYLHYSPDTGHKLGFLPGYCPLYSNVVFENVPAIFTAEAKECKVCKDVIEMHPEYESFLKTVKKSLLVTRDRSESVDIQMYNCNICVARRRFICEFDQHMKSHTMDGPLVAIVAMDTPRNVRFVLPSPGHVEADDFVDFERQFMQLECVTAVLEVFNRGRMEDYCDEKYTEHVNIFTSLLLKPGTDLEEVLSTVSFDKDLIKKHKVMKIKNIFRAPRSVLDYEEKMNFGNLLRWSDNHRFPWDYPPGTRLYERNTALLTMRCSLSYPDDRYQAAEDFNHPLPLRDHRGHYDLPGADEDYQAQALKHIWKVVKNSSLCCCVNKIFCSTSTNIEKCVESCCGKCKQDPPSCKESSDDDTESDSNSELEATDSESSSEESESYSGDQGDW